VGKKSFSDVCVAAHQDSYRTLICFGEKRIRSAPADLWNGSKLYTNCHKTQTRVGLEQAHVPQLIHFALGYPCIGAGRNFHV